MYSDRTLNSLAAMARDGDDQAASTLREELQPNLVRIVRRAIRATTDTLPLTRGVRAAAGRLLAADVPNTCSTAIAERIARFAGPVLAAGGQGLRAAQVLRETVCG